MKCKNCGRELIRLAKNEPGWSYEISQGIKYRHIDQPTKVCKDIHGTIAEYSESQEILDILSKYPN